MERSAESFDFEAIWRESLDPGENVPLRSSLKETAYKSHLSNIGLWQFVPNEKKLIGRLFGEGVYNLVNTDLRGVDVFDLLNPDQHELALERNHLLHDHPVGRVSVVSIAFGDNNPVLSENTFLPLWGNSSERFVVTLFAPVNQSRIMALQSDPMDSFKILEDELIDVGAGIPKVPSFACG